MTEKNWFSNFVRMESPIYVTNGTEDEIEEVIECWTVEAYYQAYKSDNWEDCKRILQLSPGEAKREGRKIKLIENWESEKLGIMEYALRHKFARRTEQSKLLLATGKEPIIEWNSWHDNFWGSCICWNCMEVKNPLNMLGMLLMVIRQQLDEGVI